MEFVRYDDAIELLREVGVIEASRTEERLQLALEDADALAHVRLVPTESSGVADDDASHTLSVGKDRIPDLLEHLFHKLKVQQLLIAPIGKWHRVFDAVAFSMADVEEWQEVDATASVSLNTRDPLLCEPGDLHTLRALIKAILVDAEAPDQGIMITTTKTPLMVELHPDGNVDITVANSALAAEIAKAMKS